MIKVDFKEQGISYTELKEFHVYMAIVETDEHTEIFGVLTDNKEDAEERLGPNLQRLVLLTDILSALEIELSRNNKPHPPIWLN